MKAVVKKKKLTLPKGIRNAAGGYSLRWILKEEVGVTRQHAGEEKVWGDAEASVGDTVRVEAAISSRRCSRDGEPALLDTRLRSLFLIPTAVCRILETLIKGRLWTMGTLRRAVSWACE